MTGAKPVQQGNVAGEESQRIDQWLWRARFFKTRTLAAKFVSDGNVRVTRNGDTTRIDKASANIRPGDTLVFTRNDHLKIVAVLACAPRRGPASEAQQLYEDQSPPPPPREKRTPPAFEREKGAGRPTKKDRRAIAALKAGE
jgi:ribosome-associated heat shock protein Hsp15